MERSINSNNGWRSGPWRVAAWSAAAALMLVPISVQLFSGNFGWDTADFIFAGVVLFVPCFIFDVAARRARNLPYLLATGLALAAGFGLVVVNGAVGLVGSEDEAHNLLFGTAIVVAIIGAVAARGRARAMAHTMIAAAIVHTGISAFLLIRAKGASDGNPQMEVIGLAVFAVVWLASAWLFRTASR